jgi:DNA polymerase
MDALTALRLQIEWGADEALGEKPVDRTRPAPVATPARPQAAQAQPPSMSLARQVAEAAPTIEALRTALAGFTACPLAATATNLVFSDGNPAAGLVFVGEAPGAEEDLSGKPFVGQSGQLLDRMLASIGLDRTQALITNLIPWRPPGNRPPTDNEVLMCLPFLQRHLALLQPKIVVTLGALSTHALTGQTTGIRKLRGRWINITVDSGNTPIKTLPMLHPAYLLRTPAAKRETWIDLIALRQALDAM